MSFMHLGNSTFQNTYMNPALIPEGQLFIGLPVLSGVHFNLNNKLSYNEVFTKEGGQTIVDIDKVLSNLQKQNLFSTQLNINLLHVGYKTKSGILLSFAANERIEELEAQKTELSEADRTLVRYLVRNNDLNNSI